MAFFCGMTVICGFFWVFLFDRVSGFTILVVMSDDCFEVVLHHGGYFIQNGRLTYSDGEIATWLCDPDWWSFF